MLYDRRFGHLRCLGDLYLFPNEVTCKSPFTEGLLTQNPKCWRQLRERLKAGCRGKADGIGDSLVYRSPHICTGRGMQVCTQTCTQDLVFFWRWARRFALSKKWDESWTWLYTCCTWNRSLLHCNSRRETVHMLHPWFGAATGQNHPKCCQGLTPRGTLVRKWPLKVMRFVGKPLKRHRQKWWVDGGPESLFLAKLRE